MSSITSTTTNAIGAPFNQKIFYAQDMWWLFYSNGTNLCYATNSTDNCATASFNSPIIVQNNSSNVACTTGMEFNVIFDGTYVHYVRAVGNTNTAYYRRGICNSDGTIAWQSNEVTAFTAAGASINLSSMDIDSSGNILVGFYAENKARVARNASKDGTWTNDPAYTSTGLVVCGNLTNSVNWKPMVIAMTNKKWACIFGGVTGGYLYINWWDGDSLKYDTSTAPLLFTDVAPSYLTRCSACSDGNNVYLAWNGQTSTPYHLYVRRWVYGETTISGITYDMQNVSGSNSPPYACVPVIRYNQTANELCYYFAGYPNSGSIYVRISKDGGNWTPTPTSNGTVLSTGNTLAANDMTNAALTEYNNRIIYLFLTGSGPYTISTASATFDAGIAPQVNNKEIKMMYGVSQYNGSGSPIII